VRASRSERESARERTIERERVRDKERQRDYVCVCVYVCGCHYLAIFFARRRRREDTAQIQAKFFCCAGREREKGEKRERTRDEGEKKKCHTRLQVPLSTYILTERIDTCAILKRSNLLKL